MYRSHYLVTRFLSQEIVLYIPVDLMCPRADVSSGSSCVTLLQCDPLSVMTALLTGVKRYLSVVLLCISLTILRCYLPFPVPVGHSYVFFAVLCLRGAAAGSWTTTGSTAGPRSGWYTVGETPSGPLVCGLWTPWLPQRHSVAGCRTAGGWDRKRGMT